MDLIPQTTKDNVPTFHQGLFSNDNSRMLIDGRNDNGEMVHPQATLSAWLQWSPNPQEIQNALLAEAPEYTAAEFNALKSDVNSIWYVEPVEAH
jgi:hypothetical protein